MTSSRTRSSQYACRDSRQACRGITGNSSRKWRSFTDPEYGAIGLRQSQCSDAGIDYETSVIWCEDLTRAIIDDRTAGFCQMIADRRTHKFLGAHIVGERAADGHDHGRGTDGGAGS
ncbi:hypothetical protein [Bradyrhizobium japonicum]|uniref:hypothetical protein n=1 Tax=Bradyrhizobium japonicum TaxID=375 RepID=UPI0034E385B9